MNRRLGHVLTFFFLATLSGLSGCKHAPTLAPIDPSGAHVRVQVESPTLVGSSTRLEGSMMPVVAASACSTLASESAGRVDCLTGEDIKRLLGAAMQRAQLGVECDDDECGELNVPPPGFLIRSTIRDLGDHFEIEFVALDMKNELRLGRETASATEAGDLLDIAKEPMKKFVRLMLP